MDCSGKRIAYTGTAFSYDRQDVYSAITAAKGAIDYNSVNTKTDLLIVADQNPNGLKYKNALRHGIPTVTVQEFMAKAYDGSAWPFPEPACRHAKKAKVRAKAGAKALDTSVKQLAKDTGLSGFVGF